MRGTKFELDEQKASKLSGMSVDEVWNFINQKAKEAEKRQEEFEKLLKNRRIV